MRTARRLTLAVGMALALIAAATVVREGGLGFGHVNVEIKGSAVGPDIGIQLPVTLRNEGWTPVTLTGIGGDPDEIPGLRLAGISLLPALPLTPMPPDAVFPITLAPGQSVEIGIAYEVTDCQAVPNSLTVPVRQRQWWGSWTANLRPSSTPGRAPKWLRTYALYVCGRIDAPF